MSTRLVITRSKRRLSTRSRRPSTPSPTSTGKGSERGGAPSVADEPGDDVVRACTTSSRGSTSSSESSADPASKRGDLEQLVDHPGEATKVRIEQIERALRALIEFVPVRFEHADGRREGGERRAELVAHVRGEAGLALDPVLQVGRHPVEGRRQLLEVDVVARVDPGVELTPGDRDRRIGDVGEGAKCPAARPPPEGGAGQRRHQRCAGQGVRQVTQGAGELGEREDLEVRGTRCGERHADHQLRCVGEDEELRRRRARQDAAAFGLRDRVLTDRDRGRVPLSAGVEHRQRAGQRVDRADQLADLGARRERSALWRSEALANACRCIADCLSLSKVWRAVK